MMAAAQSCDGPRAFLQQALRLVGDAVGHDGALCVDVDPAEPPTAIAPPGDASELARALRRRLWALGESGGIDLALGESGATRLLGAIRFRGRLLGGVALWRRGAFTTAERARLEDVLAVLGVAWAALAPVGDRSGLDARDRHLERFRELFATLSPRERQIARYLALGLRNRDIALILGTSPNTVRNQTCAIFEKTEASGRTELAVWLQRADLIEPAATDAHTAGRINDR
jgi:DNA-binding CsgD family transcriptional regulator